MLLLIYAALVTRDYLSTRYAVGRWGSEVEANSLWRAGFCRRSRLMDAAYLFGAALAGTARHVLLGRVGLLGLIGGFTFVNANNAIAIVRLLRRDRSEQARVCRSRREADDGYSTSR